MSEILSCHFTEIPKVSKISQVLSRSEDTTLFLSTEIPKVSNFLRCCHLAGGLRNVRDSQLSFYRDPESLKNFSGAVKIGRHNALPIYRNPESLKFSQVLSSCRWSEKCPRFSAVILQRSRKSQKFLRCCQDRKTQRSSYLQKSRKSQIFSGAVILQVV